MGAFYGSTHLRTADRDAVLEAAEKHSKRNKTRMLVGPAIGPWIAVYPENHGQDDRTARLLSKNLKCEAIHVLVHDDDYFCYCAFKSGKALDQFSSMPDYFSNVSDSER